jgi:hypothetical protein
MRQARLKQMNLIVQKNPQERSIYLPLCKKSPSGELLKSKVYKSNLPVKKGGPFASYLFKSLLKEHD